MLDEILTRIRPTIERIAELAGMELVHLEIRREGVGLVVRLYIDRPGGVTLDDCAHVSRLVSAQMDADDPISSHYTLEVSSPGLDRPLSRDQDFERFSGHQVRLSTAAPLDGRRHFRGELRGLSEGSVRLGLEDGREVAIPRDQIVAARLADDIAFGNTTGARGRHA